MTARVVELASLVWPIERIGEALAALARHAGLIATAAAGALRPPTDAAELDRWLAAAGAQLGVAVDSTTVSYRDVDAALAAMHPSMIRVAAGVVLALGYRGDRLSCLRPDGAVCATSRRAFSELLRAPHERSKRPQVAKLLARSTLSARARDRAERSILAELLAVTPVMTAWVVSLPPSARFIAQVRAAGLGRIGAKLVAAHVAQYALFLVSWWIIGSEVLRGHVAPGWLSGWTLVVLGSVPLAMLSTWYQGRLAVGLGMLLRRRLLAGALALAPEVIHRDGIGRLLGRAIEADNLERLALGGGFTSALAVVELALAVPVLAVGAGGAAHVTLLAAWLVICGVLLVRLMRARQRWTDQRLVVTGLTVERVVGHRTRLAQELPDHWHDGEDEALAGYLDRSAELDRRSVALLVFVPRAWLIAGLCVLAPEFIAATDRVGLGTGIGGVVLTWLSLTRLCAGLDQLATARVAWQRVAPLFRAAAMPAVGAPSRTDPEYVVMPPSRGTELVLELVDVSFRHATRSTDVLAGCSLEVRSGDHVLVQGPSGSGKSTIAGLLAGMRTPSSGLVLARGLDMSCLGDRGWRARVSAAPQFHENHILTESLAFNVLMARGWPPRPEDVTDARVVCEELGLRPLLDRMPAGIFEMVGETGWQLSHGERSRVYIARALLQNADVVILDESLAALDPENMALTLRCVRARARSLVVIAHP